VAAAGCVDAADPGLAIRSEAGGGRAVTVWLTGALVHDAPVRLAGLVEHHRAGGDRLLVDITDLTIADQAGLDCLASIARRGALVINASPRVAALLAQAPW
jgi:hypothetical protein